MAKTTSPSRRSRRAARREERRVAQPAVPDVARLIRRGSHHAQLSEDDGHHQAFDVVPIDGDGPSFTIMVWSRTALGFQGACADVGE